MNKIEELNTIYRKSLNQQMLELLSQASKNPIPSVTLDAVELIHPEKPRCWNLEQIGKSGKPKYTGILLTGIAAAVYEPKRGVAFAYHDFITAGLRSRRIEKNIYPENKKKLTDAESDLRLLITYDSAQSQIFQLLMKLVLKFSELPDSGEKESTKLYICGYGFIEKRDNLIPLNTLIRKDMLRSVGLPGIEISNEIGSYTGIMLGVPSHDRFHQPVSFEQMLVLAD